MLPNDHLHRAAEASDAAKAALTHLGPAFDAVEAIYAERLREVAVKEPWAADKLRALALAQKISEAVRGHIEAIMLGGEVADKQLDRVRKIEKMSPERRRILGL